MYNRGKDDTGGDALRTIYVDVLLVCGLYMNYILLRLTARITHTRLSFGRTMLGAGLGSLSSLIILLPTMPVVLSLLYKLITAILICTAAFGRRNAQRLLWHCICFLGMSCLLAGILMALALSGFVRIYHANASWYPDISLWHLIFFTIGAYLLLTIVQRIHDRTHVSDGDYQVHIRYGTHTAMLEGLADTGNSLVDFYTGKPVIICDKSELSLLLPEHLPPKGFRPLPCATVAGNGMVLCFTPDEVVIRSDHGTKAVDVLIGMSEQETHKAIFNPKLLYY